MSLRKCIPAHPDKAQSPYAPNVTDQLILHAHNAWVPKRYHQDNADKTNGTPHLCKPFRLDHSSIPLMV